MDSMHHFFHPVQSELWIFMIQTGFHRRQSETTHRGLSCSFSPFVSITVHAIPRWLGIGTVALPSQPGQVQQTTHWLLCPQEQCLPFQLAFCLEAKRKCISRDLWSKQKKAARILQPPAGIFPWGRRETSVQSQGWSSGGSEGGGRLRLGGLSAVPGTAASPTLTQTL